MNRISIIGLLLLLLLAFIISSNATNLIKEPTYSITLMITNLRNKKGRVQVQIYKDQESFAKEIPWKSSYISKKNSVNNSLTHTISGFKSGIYGVALLDDENSDTKMDYGWFMPKEGFGFSDYYHTSWSKPTFHDFKFNLKENKKVIMKVRYL